MILTEAEGTRPVQVELLGAIVVDGAIRDVGEVVTVEYDTWLNLKARGKAVQAVGNNH